MVIPLGAAAFVFNRNGPPKAGAIRERGSRAGWGVGRSAVEFDDVGLAGEAEAERAEGEPAGSHDFRAGFCVSFVDAGVQEIPLCSKTVLGPDLFEVNQGPLPFAEGEMLESRKGEEFVLGEGEFR
jgi:hypothetical protein